MAAIETIAGGSGSVTSTIAAFTTRSLSASAVGAGVLALTVAALSTATPVRASGAGAVTIDASSVLLYRSLPSVSSFLRGQGAASVLVSGACLTVWDAALDVYGLWKVEVKNPLDLDLARNRILSAINSILQQIWSRASKLNYFNRETVSLTLDALTELVLDADIQEVIGPVNVANGKSLLPLKSPEELRGYVDYYYGGTAPDRAPEAYLIYADQDTTADRTRLTLKLPWSTATLALEALVVKRAPHYAAANISAATPIRLPAQYVELIFLPLLREWAASDHLFKSESARPGILAAAVLAREALGLLEPSPIAVKEASS